MQKTFYCLKATKDGKDLFIKVRPNTISIYPEVVENFSEAAVTADNFDYLCLIKGFANKIFKDYHFDIFSFEVQMPKFTLINP